MVVEVWSDLACPWCFIGKRHLEAALAEFEHRDDVEVVWRSFQLAPDMPARVEGGLTELLASKYGVSADEAAAMNARVTGVAAAAGLEYDLDHAQPSNTFDAHRVTQLAADRGVQGDVVERLFGAYFAEGRRLSDPETLAALGAEAGLAAEDVTSLLAGDAYADEVRRDVADAQRFGLSGVPAFVIDRAYLVSGAQPPEAILGALDRAWSDTHPAGE